MLPPALEYATEANATAIYAGEPVKIGGTGNNFVVPSADAEPLVAAVTFAGIAATNSTQTATANGVVSVFLPLPGIVWGCKAKSAAAIDTAAELLALRNLNILFDLTSGTYTVDTAASATSADNGLKVVGGDTTNGIVYFTIRQSCTQLN